MSGTTRAMSVLAALLLVLSFRIGGDLIEGNKPDFASFYAAARIMRAGTDVSRIYDPAAIAEVAQEQGYAGHAFPYLYPPVLAQLLSPFVAPPFRVVAKEWTLLNLLLFPFVLLLCVAAFRPNAAWAGAAALCVLLALFLPFRLNVRMGQANILVLAFIGLALWLKERGRDFESGAALALAGLLKVIPLALLLLFVPERRLRAWLSCAVTCLCGVALSCALGAGPAWMAFLRQSTTMSYGQSVPGLFPPDTPWNFSLAGFFARLVGDAPGTIRLATIAALLFLMVCFVARLVRAAQPAASGPLLLALLTLMIIASPLCYLHHVLYLLPGAFAVFVNGGWPLDPHVDTRRRITLLVLAAALVIAGIDLTTTRLVPSPNLLALLAVFGCSLLLTREVRPAVAKAEEGRRAFSPTPGGP